MALKMHSDWLLKHWISFAVHLRATCSGFAPENIVIVARINELKTIFLSCIILTVYYILEQSVNSVSLANMYR